MSAAAGPGPSPLRVGLISRTFYYVPVWAAMQHGWFDAAGISVALGVIGADAQADRLLAGDLDLTIAPPEGVLQDASRGGRLRMLAGNSGALSHDLIAQPEIRRVEELRGKRFGMLTRKEGSFFHFRTMARAHGLEFPGGYEVVETGGAPLRHQALIDGSIDAGLQSVPWTYAAEALGFSNLGPITDYVPQWQFNTVNADGVWALANAERVTRFLAVLLRAVEWTYSHPEEAAGIASAQLPVSLEHARRAWQYFTSSDKLTRDMSLTADGLAAVIEAQVEAQLMQPVADPLFAADLSYLAAARQRAKAHAKPRPTEEHR